MTNDDKENIDIIVIPYLTIVRYLIFCRSNLKKPDFGTQYPDNPNL